MTIRDRVIQRLRESGAQAGPPPGMLVGRWRKELDQLRLAGVLRRLSWQVGEAFFEPRLPAAECPSLYLYVWAD